MIKRYKMTLGILFVILALWVTVTSIDYSRVYRSSTKPAFAIPINTSVDGTSVTYLGLGYSFSIKKSSSDVTEKDFYLFGVCLQKSIAVYD